jgi:hypothetical protein
MASLDNMLEEVLRPNDPANGFTKIDDVNLVVFLVYVGSHGRMPAAGTVTEVNACFDEFLDLQSGHCRSFRFSAEGPSRQVAHGVKDSSARKYDLGSAQEGEIRH